MGQRCSDESQAHKKSRRRSLKRAPAVYSVAVLSGGRRKYENSMTSENFPIDILRSHDWNFSSISASVRIFRTTAPAFFRCRGVCRIIAATLPPKTISAGVNLRLVALNPVSRLHDLRTLRMSRSRVPRVTMACPSLRAASVATVLYKVLYVKWRFWNLLLGLIRDPP